MKFENEKLFSIITVCYNAALYLPKTMESVLVQSNPNYEYIIVDGGSKDSTINVIQEFEHRFEGKMKWISEKDRGIYDAMNKAITLSEGTYLIFINANDELDPNILNKVQMEIEKFDYLPDIIYGDALNSYDYNNQNVKKLKKAWNPITVRTLKKGMGVVHQSMFTKYSLFNEIGTFNIEYTIGADWDFLIRCVKGGKKLYYIPEVVSVFPTDGVSSGCHNKQRHLIRKNNNLYRCIDFNYILDAMSISNFIKTVFGMDFYRKLRYLKNANKEI
ncbi:MAG: glycosyltransferase family 2 protein [Lachnospiraceae bacterium]